MARSLPRLGNVNRRILSVAVILKDQAQLAVDNPPGIRSSRRLFVPGIVAQHSAETYVGALEWTLLVLAQALSYLLLVPNELVVACRPDVLDESLNSLKE